MQRRIRTISDSAEATFQLGEKLASLLQGTETIGLVAPLGSGKTHFVKGLAKGLGVKTKILSPTFVLERIHKVGDRTKLHHFDAYRIGPNEAIGIGLTELFGEDIVVIEWADRVRPLLPKDTIWIEIKSLGECKREIRFAIAENRNYIYEGLR